MTVVSASQMTLNFEPGLTERYFSLLDCVRSGVYTHRSHLKTIASDMDMSQSELSRKLSDNPDDPRRLSVNDFEKYLATSGDLTPLYWLVERFLADEDLRQRRAQAELVKKMPEILAMLQAAVQPRK